MITVRAKSGQQRSRIGRYAFKLTHRCKDLAGMRLIVTDGETEYVFYPKSLTEYYRAVTFFTKEEGTIAWLRNSLGDSEVFCDIGANIGLYSIYAAKLGRSIKAYAFEPHKFTFVSLMENISHNSVLSAVAPIAIPLGDMSEPSTLNYANMEAGTSMSQLGHNMHPEDGAFAPQLSEVVYCTTLDELVGSRSIPAPHHVKIDVDGNEIKILKGMVKLLASASKPKTMQVEINASQRPGVTALLTSYGYKLDHVHYSAKGQIKINEQGADPESVAHNAVFVVAR